MALRTFLVAVSLSTLGIIDAAFRVSISTRTRLSKNLKFRSRGHDVDDMQKCLATPFTKADEA